jgi:hypothetical protein
VKVHTPTTAHLPRARHSSDNLTVPVEGFCEPIFTRDEMDDLLRVAAEIEGMPPARTGSTYLLVGPRY